MTSEDIKHQLIWTGDSLTAPDYDSAADLTSQPGRTNSFLNRRPLDGRQTDLLTWPHSQDKPTVRVTSASGTTSSWDWALSPPPLRLSVHLSLVFNLCVQYNTDSYQGDYHRVFSGEKKREKKEEGF